VDREARGRRACEARTASAAAALIVTLAAGSALASGNEGAGLVDAVRLIVAIVLGTFAASITGGVGVGIWKARRSESILREMLRGLGKGFLAFLVICAVLMTLVTIGGGVYIAYALVTAPR
jgi:hypothetical protein